MHRFGKLVWILFFLSLPAFAKTVPLVLELEPGSVSEIDLAEKTQLKGPFHLVSGPSWVTVNAQGTLFVNASDFDLGDHAVELEVRSGSTWVKLSIQLKILYFKYGVKVFSAPWCQTCRTLIPDIEKSLRVQFKRPIDFQVYLETDYDIYEAPSQKTADDYKKELGLSAPVNADAWKWQEYRKYFPTGFQLPAAVIYREGEKTKTTLGPGHFEADAVIHSLNGLMQTSTQADLRILWVIDNSGSMYQNQSLIVSSANELFTQLHRQKLRWTMSMVTTDLKDTPLLPLVGPDLLSWTTAKGADIFSSRVLAAGTAGNGVEAPFGSVVKHLGDNPGFLSAGHNLAIVVVTDEDDQSTLTTQEYLQSLAQLSGDIRRVRQFTLTTAKDLGCVDTSGSFPSYKGSRHEEVTRFTKGKVFPLCNFSTQLGGFVRSLTGSF